MKPQRVFLEAVSIAAPGMENWLSASSVLRGEQSYAPSELSLYQPTLLPANERRRASGTVRMGFRVAEAACAASSIAAADLAAVFASADGDLHIAQRICAALAQTSRLVSPTDFHNSVHNAAAGYWSIAALAKGPSTAIAGGDHSFTAGLLEALCMVQVERRPTLLVAYDLPAPSPMQDKRPVSQPFGCGLILSAQPTAHSLAALTAELIPATTASRMQNDALEALRLTNPAARSLALLQALATRNRTALDLDSNAATLRLQWQFDVTS